MSTHVSPSGEAYRPSKKSVLVIAPGSGWVCYEEVRDEFAMEVKRNEDALTEAGYDVTVVGERGGAYDHYPQGFLEGYPNINSHGGKNHMSLADDVVVPKILELIEKGRGPSVIIAGSRGGQCTLPRLWALGWRGAAICINAGVAQNPKCQVPSSGRLVLITGGKDFFPWSANPRLMLAGGEYCLKREMDHQPILLYHDPNMAHTGGLNENDFPLLPFEVLIHIMQLASVDASFWDACAPHTHIHGPWPAQASLQII